MNNDCESHVGSATCECWIRPATHLGWKGIKDCSSKILYDLLGKQIAVEVMNAERLRWGLCELNPPITKDEMKIINEYAEADKDDLFVQEGTNYPTSEIDQELAQKLISKILPFHVYTSLVDDDGVWLVGESEDKNSNGKNAYEPPKCSCGNSTFTAHQRCYHDVLVDGNNMFVDGRNIYEAEKPYGPYHCTACNKEYNELDELKLLNAGVDAK